MTHRGAAAGLEQIEGRVHIRVAGADGIGHRAWNAGKRGDMIDHLHAVDGGRTHIDIAEVALPEFYAIHHVLEIPPVSGGGVVDDPDELITSARVVFMRLCRWFRSVACFAVEVGGYHGSPDGVQGTSASKTNTTSSARLPGRCRERRRNAVGRRQGVEFRSTGGLRCHPRLNVILCIHARPKGLRPTDL